jgi:hypothetical protein
MGVFFGRDVGCVSCSIRRTLGFLELELLTAMKVSGGLLANGIFFFLSGDTCLAYLPTCTRNQVHGSVQIGRYRVSRSQVGLGWMHDDKTIFS